MSDESQTGEATEESTAVSPDASSSEDTSVNSPDVEEVNSPSNESADTAEETIDMNDVLSVPATKEKRGGLSRKEYKEKEKQETQSNELDELRGQVEELKGLLSSTTENAEYLQQTREQVERARMEEKFHSTLKNKGVDAATFNAEYKDAFKEEQQDLLDSGLSLEKATEKALKITLASYQADTKVKDVQKRSEGRAKATIPPTSTATTDKTVYTEAQIMKMDQADYNRIMDLRDKGEVQIVR